MCAATMLACVLGPVVGIFGVIALPLLAIVIVTWRTRK